jgi:hypothetical protein
MGIFSPRRPRVRRIPIQATEGAKPLTYVEGLFEPQTGSTIGGTANSYSTYSSQVTEQYRKYNGEAAFGNQQCRAVIDIRTSFISGDGPSINAENPKTREFIDEFVKVNRLFGSRFFDLVLGGEMTGKQLVFLKRQIGEMPKAIRVPWTPKEPWTVILSDKWDPESITGIMIKRDGVNVPLNISNFAYFRLGGDDYEVNKTTTRVGVVLNEFENYDRALKDLRLNNHVSARITPNLQTDSDEETEEAVATFKKSRWKIGKMRIGTGKFTYETPGMGAAENLRAEMAATLKTIAATTGIPVHWIGWADLMNNRATADSLYETINNATLRERNIYADGYRDLLIKAQEVYINSGGTMISAVDEDISVSIPVVDRSDFINLVRGLSIAFSDEAISMADYRSALPGIDPMETQRQVAAEKEAREKELVINPTVIPPVDENQEPAEPDEE